VQGARVLKPGRLLTVVEAKVDCRTGSADKPTGRGVGDGLLQSTCPKERLTPLAPLREAVDLQRGSLPAAAPTIDRCAGASGPLVAAHSKQFLRGTADLITESTI